MDWRDVILIGCIKCGTVQTCAPVICKGCYDELIAQLAAAKKCIVDVETYLDLGSTKYIRKTIDEFRVPKEAEQKRRETWHNAETPPDQDGLYWGKKTTQIQCGLFGISQAFGFYLLTLKPKCELLNGHIGTLSREERAMMDSYIAVYKCQLCGTLVQCGEPNPVPYDELPALCGKVVKDQLFAGNPYLHTAVKAEGVGWRTLRGLVPKSNCVKSPFYRTHNKLL